MSITLTGVTKEETAYDKRITFTHEGEEYSVILHWDMYDGFDLNFLEGRMYTQAPDWAVDWDEEDTLEYHLDCLSDEVIEGSY